MQEIKTVVTDTRVVDWVNVDVLKPITVERKICSGCGRVHIKVMKNKTLSLTKKGRDNPALINYSQFYQKKGDLILTKPLIDVNLVS